MQELLIIKVGGNVIDDEGVLKQLLIDFCAAPSPKILVHGGGALADKLLVQLNIKPIKIDGRRITDLETLDVAVMVYAGSINKKIVAQLNAQNCTALGLTGADLNIIKAHKRPVKTIDYGFAGDIESVDALRIQKLFSVADALVFAPITCDDKGQLLNTNADTITSELAVALSKNYSVNLKFIFDSPGVLTDRYKRESVIPILSFSDYNKGISEKIITDGMIPKLHNAFMVHQKGIHNVTLCGADNWLSGGGTKIC